MPKLRRVIRLTQPTVEPLSLAEARESLRISPRQTIDASYINDLISSAREQAEQFIDQAICLANFVLIFDDVSGNSLRLIYPANSVASVSYRNADGDEIEPEFEYDPQLNEIFFAETVNCDGLKVEVECGRNTGHPESLVRAIAMLLGDLYTGRTSAEYVNKAAQMMLMPFRNRPII